MEGKSLSLNEKLLPTLIAGSASLVVGEMVGVSGIASGIVRLVIFFMTFAVVSFVAEYFLYKGGFTRKKKIVGMLIFILLTAIFTYLKVEHQPF